MKLRPVAVELFHPEVRTYMRKITAKVPAQNRRIYMHTVYWAFSKTGNNAKHLLPVQD